MTKSALILCPYSAPSQCGIWMRTFADTISLTKNGFNVEIWSSNILKGTNEKLNSDGISSGIKIKRFKVWLKLGGTSMLWFPFFRILRTKPDIVHTHGYRHPHSLQALIAGKLLGKPVFLTTHAPFEKDSRRSILMKFIDLAYDWLIGWWELKLYAKVIRISDWESEYLKKLWVDIDKKTVFIPNGIDEKFLTSPQPSPSRRGGNLSAIFLGRLDPVKRVEWVLKAAQQLPDLKFMVRGPIQGYSDEWIKKFSSNQQKNFTIDSRPYTKEEAIELLDQSDIFLFPSVRESFGIVGLEAMARGCVLLASNTKGVNEYLIDGKNGYIFNDFDELIDKLKMIQENPNILNTVSAAGRKTAENYSAEEMGKKLVELYSLHS